MITGIFLNYAITSNSEKVSQFGKYNGYSEPIYDGYERKSDYMSLSDGTKLAYELLLPTKGGVVAQDPLPVLFSYTTYLRAYNMVKDGKVVDNKIFPVSPVKKAFIWLRAKLKKNGNIFDRAFLDKWVKKMLKHGYAVVIVEQRGTGASEGMMSPIFKFMADDANDVLNWIVAQSWSNGKIGMFGKSSLAMAQYAAASTENPHLKAIFPISSSFDMYNAIIYSGGILNTAFTKMFAFSTDLLENMIVPVDSDKDGARLEEILEHRRRTYSMSKGAEKSFEKSPYRDSDSPLPKGDKHWKDLGLYTLLDQINKSNVAIYNTTGWFDIFTRDAFLWHNNLKVKRKLYIRPVSHYALGQNKKDLDSGAEAHRWFDYWLKGIDNGIMEEPPIHYFVIDTPEKDSWKTAKKWPLQNERRSRFYFSAVDSENKGLLTTEKPQSPHTYDSYTTDYSTTSGVRSRWNSVIQDCDYPNMVLNDKKALTYTSLPLEEDLEVTGHPVVYLFISAQAADIDFFVYLEEVDNKGKSTYITEGCLRASHRTVGEAPFNNLGLPFHRSFKEDLKPLPSGEPVEIIFDLLPTSKLFRKGSRIRVSITCADSDNFKSPVLDPAPEVHILRNSIYASFIDIPIIPDN